MCMCFHAFCHSFGNQAAAKFQYIPTNPPVNETNLYLNPFYNPEPHFIRYPCHLSSQLIYDTFPVFIPSWHLHESLTYRPTEPLNNIPSLIHSTFGQSYLYIIHHWMCWSELAVACRHHLTSHACVQIVCCRYTITLLHLISFSV